VRLRVKTRLVALMLIFSGLVAVDYLGSPAINTTVQAATCNCGPDYCLNDPRYLAKLAAKKSDMAKAGYPADLIALMDRDGACVARIERAPDGFKMKLVSAEGSKIIDWTADGEKLARQQLLNPNGTLKAYYKFNVNRAFSCCGEAAHDKRSDWDPALDLNLGLLIACSKQGSAVMCR
jgi:hypothetical protein